jgi:hypothetical protein
MIRLRSKVELVPEEDLALLVQRQLRPLIQRFTQLRALK